MIESQPNVAEFTVSELSAALKRTVEDNFGYVRVRGEISGYKGPHGSGHVYFALKDQTAKIDAVIRDILHRLADRFPRHVIVWPVKVQGDGSAEQVAAAIRGFNALPADGPIRRPDLLIVARGGGSLEDLWSFNEEIVVRAAAESMIPLISAVGHETDVTLIDFASDR